MITTKKLLDDEKFLKPVFWVVEMEANKVTEVRSKHEEQINQFAQVKEKPLSDRSSASDKSPARDVSDGRANEKAY